MNQNGVRITGPHETAKRRLPYPTPVLFRSHRIDDGVERDRLGGLSHCRRNALEFYMVIEELMDGVQQATTDIAHDLKTPLSRLRNDLESTRTASPTTQEYQCGIDRAIDAADNILQIFTALLRIAEIEAGAQRTRFTRIDLSHLAHHVCEAFESVAEDQRQRLTAEIDQDVYVTGDRDLLIQLLANLIENAITHCPPRTAIRIKVVHYSGRAALVVTDTGPGIPAAEHENVMRRFYRLERSRTTRGSGLGLSLVRAIWALHEAELELSDAAPGLCVQIIFP